jgi:hypothetical protein
MPTLPQLKSDLDALALRIQRLSGKEREQLGGIAGWTRSTPWYSWAATTPSSSRAARSGRRSWRAWVG